MPRERTRWSGRVRSLLIIAGSGRPFLVNQEARRRLKHGPQPLAGPYPHLLKRCPGDVAAQGLSAVQSNGIARWAGFDGNDLTLQLVAGRRARQLRLGENYVRSPDAHGDPVLPIFRGRSARDVGVQGDLQAQPRTNAGHGPVSGIPSLHRQVKEVLYPHQPGHPALSGLT